MAEVSRYYVELRHIGVGVEYVDDIARADLIADFGGFQSALVGYDRLLACLHGLDIGLSANPPSGLDNDRGHASLLWFPLSTHDNEARPPGL